MNKATNVKKQILASQIAYKRTQNNEVQLERALAKFFNKLKKEVLNALDEYWKDYQMLQGHIDLITAPVHEAHKEYYELLTLYIKREYRLGSAEAKRLVRLANSKQRVASKSMRMPVRAIIKKDNDLFGTLPSAEERLLNRTFTASERTLARVDSQINQIITDGYRSGKGINDVANSLNQRFDQLTSWESKRIARTEIHNSHNVAVMDTYKELDVEYTMWVAAEDERTRDSHLEINGEIIPMGGTYSNGLAFPGDTSGDIEEWINCRCSNAPFVVPYGFMAPSFSPFREDDLIKVDTKPITTEEEREFAVDVDGSIMAEQDKEQLKIDYSNNEKAAVRNYGFSSYEINGFLYKTPYMRRLVGSINDLTQKRRFLGKINRKVKLIEAAIDKSPRLVKDTKLYRAGPLPEGLKVGDRGVFDGFTSVTFSEKIARGFLNKPTRYLYVIESPAGTKGIRINGQLNCSNAEDELLLQLKQEFDVNNIDHEKKEILIRLVN